MSDNKEIARLLLKLNLVYQDYKLSDHTARIYSQALAGIEVNKLQKATDIYLKIGDKFPPPSVLRNIAFAIDS